MKYAVYCRSAFLIENKKFLTTQLCFIISALDTHLSGLRSEVYSFALVIIRYAQVLYFLFLK